MRIEVLKFLNRRLKAIIGELSGLRIGCPDALGERQGLHRFFHLLQRPTQIDGRGTGRSEQRASPFQPLIGRIGPEPQAHAIGCGGANERRAAHLHGFDRAGRIGECLQPHNFELMRQPRLIDDTDSRAAAIEPDGPVVNAADIHCVLQPALMRGLPHENSVDDPFSLRCKTENKNGAVASARAA